jgi:hypothetical protein
MKNMVHIDINTPLPSNSEPSIRFDVRTLPGGGVDRWLATVTTDDGRSFRQELIFGAQRNTNH